MVILISMFSLNKIKSASFPFCKLPLCCWISIIPAGVADTILTASHKGISAILVAVRTNLSAVATLPKPSDPVVWQLRLQ